MATNPDSVRLTEEYRRQNKVLRAQMIRDLQTLWPALDWTRLDATFPAWLEAVQLIVARDSRRSQNLAGAYVRAFRAAEGVPGTGAVVLGAAVDREHLETSLRINTLVAAKKSAAAGKNPQRAMADAFVTSTGAATRFMLNAGRETVSKSVLRDPHGVGWRRRGSGETCQFCYMLVTRGAVYKEATAKFASHPHCACTAEPDYGGKPIKVDEYVQTARNMTDADRSRVRDWLRDNPTAG